MRLFKYVFLVLIVILSLGASSAQDNTGTVSIVGKNKDLDTDPTFGLILVTDNATWRESEDNHNSHYFKTKEGIYIRKVTTVTLMDANNKAVGLLQVLVPETAKLGDKGEGQALETGINFRWEVK